MWLHRFPSTQKRKGRLVCFHHAGGNPQVFQPWSEWLGSEIEIVSIELPGHGMRYREELISTAEEIAVQVIPHIINFFDEPICFLGHSMGAFLAYETVRRLIELNAKPNHLYVISASPPHIKRKQISHKSDELFLQDVYQLGGVTEELFRDPDLKDYLLPILRNDFRLTELYDKKENLACPLTVYAGDKDVLSPKDLERWMDIKPETFTLKIFQGNHFFLHEEHSSFQRTLKKSLLQQMKQDSEGNFA